jgi:hypothetical protein
MSVYSDPALWEQAKAKARKRMGGHSARAMQLAGRLYRAAGGRYVGKRTKAQKSLERWTDQDWTTKSGKPSRETGERYLPRKVIEKLTPAEYGATTRAKRESTAAGQQFVKQPARIAAKVAKLKGNPMKQPTPAQLAARARFAEMARSGAFKRKAKRKTNPLGVSGGRYEILWGGSGDLKASYDDLGQAKDFLDDIDRPPGLFYGRDIKTGKHFFSFAAMTKFPHLEIRGTAMQKAYKANPAKKTVSEKISQLTRECYPQKQAVAIALSEERAGKVKRNPMPNRVTEMIYQQLGGDRFAMMTGAKNFVAYPDLLEFSIPRNASSANQVRVFYEPSSDLYTLEFLRTKGLKSFGVARFAEVYADQLQPFFTQVTGMYTSLGTMGRKTNPRASNPATGTKKSRTKLNPSGKKVYQVYRTFTRGYARGLPRTKVLAQFNTKADAVQYAQAYANAYGVQLRIRTEVI